MENIIEIYKEQLSIKEKKLIEIKEKIEPLQKEYDKAEKDIQALKQLIGVESQSEKTIIKEKAIGPMSNKSPIEAYTELGSDYFKDESFKEHKIREIATEQGLEVNGKAISGSYSRSIITRLIEKRVFEKVKKGVYRYNKDYFPWDETPDD